MSCGPNRIVTRLQSPCHTEQNSKSAKSIHSNVCERVYCSSANHRHRCRSHRMWTTVHSIEQKNDNGRGARSAISFSQEDDETKREKKNTKMDKRRDYFMFQLAMFLASYHVFRSVVRSAFRSKSCFAYENFTIFRSGSFGWPLHRIAM